MIRNLIQTILKKRGYEIIKRNTRLDKEGLPVDFDVQTKEIIKETKSYTLTSPERIASLVNAIQYITKNQIQGDIVECGVWKGGSSMAAIKSLIKANDITRDIYLYDTFEGMSAPTKEDKAVDGESAEVMLTKSDINDATSVWCFSTIE
jgi:hypothetical protein